KGWFDQTLAASRDRIGEIAILRIDGDWYESVRCCLNSLYDQVVEDGFVILDDYYMWNGCTVATHEFLGQRLLAHHIESLGCDDFLAAVFRKGTTTWNRFKQISLSGADIQQNIPGGASFILVDGQHFGPDLNIEERRAQPFLERDGHYWGSPADDSTA